MPDAWLHSCVYCGDRTDVPRERIRKLQLLALLEHPDALPAELAMRLARELLALAGHRSTFHCDPVGELRQ
jgi:hypothetical protein